MNYYDGLRACDQEILSIIGESFLCTVPIELKAIASASESHDWASLTRHALALRGLSASLGAMPIVDILKRLEACGRREQGDPRLISELAFELALLSEALQARLARPAD